MTKKDDNVSLLKPSLLIGAVTLASRLLGLIRARLEATVLGGGAVASAWLLAFSIPNLFRRLLGEGALGTALTPLIAGIEKENGKMQLKKELAVVFAVLSILFLKVSIFVVALFNSSGGKLSGYCKICFH